MTSLAEINCLVILQAAWASPLGIVVTTNAPLKARAALYDARKHDPELSMLHIRVSPNDSEHEIWIIKRQAAPALNALELL
jgi:hypothetical protein